ncbi:MAG: glycosyltransferase family 39 protein [Actinomycetota bacterium]
MQAPPAQPSASVAVIPAADPSIRAFWAFVLVHVAAWTIAPAIAQRSVPFDTVEMLYWGRAWQWGYYKHPPLPAWIAELCSAAFGSADWPLYLASQICVAASFLAAWLLARRMLAPWPALATVMLLEACPFLNFTTPQWNNNGPTKPCWAFATLFLFDALTRRDWRCWAGAGVALGFGMLAKYDAVLLIAAMLGFLVVHPAARWAWRTPGPYLMLAVAAILVAPHAAWLLAGDAPSIAYIRARVPETRTLVDHVVNPLHFLLAQVGAVAGVPLLCASVYGWSARIAPLEAGRRFQRDFLIAMVLGPPALALSASLLTGMRMVAVWGSPMWTFFGLLLWMLFQPSGTNAVLWRLMRRSLAWGTVMLVAFTVAKALHGELAGRVTRVQVPGRELAADIGRHWTAVTDEPLHIVGGDWWLAGIVAFYHPQRPQVFPDLRAEWAPWTSDAELRRTGGVVVWPGTGPMPEEWRRRFPRVIDEVTISLPVRGWFRDLRSQCRMAIVPPSSNDEPMPR